MVHRFKFKNFLMWLFVLSIVFTISGLVYGENGELPEEGLLSGFVSGAYMGQFWDPWWRPHTTVGFHARYSTPGTQYFTGPSGQPSDYTSWHWHGQYYHELALSTSWLLAPVCVCMGQLTPCGDRQTPSNHHAWFYQTWTSIIENDHIQYTNAVDIVRQADPLSTYLFARSGEEIFGNIEYNLIQESEPELIPPGLGLVNIFRYQFIDPQADSHLIDSLAYSLLSDLRELPSISPPFINDPNIHVIEEPDEVVSIWFVKHHNGILYMINMQAIPASPTSLEDVLLEFYSYLPSYPCERMCKAMQR
jgi:hypothetical protein